MIDWSWIYFNLRQSGAITKVETFVYIGSIMERFKRSDLTITEIPKFRKVIHLLQNVFEIHNIRNIIQTRRQVSQISNPMNVIIVIKVCFTL